MAIAAAVLAVDANPKKTIVRHGNPESLPRAPSSGGFGGRFLQRPRKDYGLFGPKTLLEHYEKSVGSLCKRASLGVRFQTAPTGEKSLDCVL